MASKDWVSAAEAGQVIKSARDRISLTQEQVADALAVDKSYISKLEGGQHHAGRSKYFPKLVDVLQLTEAEIQILNPAAVVTFAAPAPSPSRGGPPIPPVIPFRETPISIPPELQEMVEKHGDAYPVLKTERMQRMLAAPRNFGGAEVGPQTAEDWFDYWMANKRFLT